MQYSRELRPQLRTYRACLFLVKHLTQHIFNVSSFVVHKTPISSDEPLSGSILFSREMAIAFLYSFVLTVSAMTVAVNAQTFVPLQFAGVNIAGFGEHYTCTVIRHVQTDVPQTSVVVQMALASSPKLSPLSTNYPVGFILKNPRTL
jgi:hypothetical protein